MEAVSSRGGRIDVLINNAGYELAPALEELSSEEARAQFETNFFGVVRMVNAVLPLVRRQTRGHIINISSLAGRSAIPFLGFYWASKFALEGYAEALRHEVKPLNIHASLTEAGLPFVLPKRRRQDLSLWPARCTRLFPATLRGCAT